MKQDKKLQITNLKNIDIENNEIDRIIQPFITDNLKKKDWIEIYQTGKFISLLDFPLKIEEKREAPDFIVKYNDEFIGLEHRLIKDKNKTESFNSISNLLDDAAIVFSNKHPGINIIVNFELNTEKLKIRKNERNALIDTIVDYIYNYLCGQNTTKPDFIFNIDLMDHSMVSFNYNPAPHNIQQLSVTELSSAIKEKEENLIKYKPNSNCSKQWLLLIISCDYPDSFSFNDDTQPSIGIESNFDRIYLLEDLRCKLWRIK